MGNLKRNAQREVYVYIGTVVFVYVSFTDKYMCVECMNNIKRQK